MKLAKACRECRISKRKCKEPTQDAHTGCLPCQQRNLKCSKSIDPLARRQQGLPQLASNGSSNSDDKTSAFSSLSYEDILECVNLYMRFVHDRPHSIFHEKTLWAHVRTRKISDCLLTAICAMGCRFSINPQHSELGTDLRIKSSSLFAQQLETISLSNIQTCILLANLYAAEQDNGLEALYFGIANRMARVLRLHETNVLDTPILRELKCRIWWALYVADKWCPPGLGLPYEITSSNYSIDLPMDERVFQRMDPKNQTHDNPPDGGLWKYIVTLTDILGPVQDLNRSLVQGTYLKEEINQRVSYLAERLQIWHDTLPQHMVMNNENLDMYRSHGHGGTFVALHFGYHHYSTLLYFPYLDPPSSDLSPSTTTAIYANRCRQHALSYSQLLRTARQKRDCHAVYLTVAYLTMVSSSVLLHVLLFSADDEEVEIARMHLIYNFEALVELRKYWPHMHKITQRLLTFQDSCLKSRATANAKTHKMDRWMVRFLLEHALPLEEKDVRTGGGGGNDDGNEAVSHPTTSTSSLTPISTYGVLAARTDMLHEAFADLCR